jgi:hypothetical protein
MLGSINHKGENSELNNKGLKWLSLITGIALLGTLLVYYMNADSKDRAVEEAQEVALQAIGSKVELDIPENYVSMSEEELKKKYPSGQVLKGWTDPTGTRNVIMQAIPQDQGLTDRTAFVDTFQRLLEQQYKEITWNAKQNVLIDGQEGTSLAFTTSSPDGTDVFNKMIIISSPPEWIIISYNDITGDSSAQTKTVAGILDSVRITKPTSDAGDAKSPAATTPRAPTDADDGDLDLTIPNDSITFTDSKGNMLLLGMKKADIDKLLGSSEEHVIKTGLTSNVYGSGTVYYYNGSAVYIKTMEEQYVSPLTFGNGDHLIKIGSSMSEIRSLFGEPISVNKGRAKLASTIVAYLFEIEGNRLKKIVMPPTKIDKKMIYVDFTVSFENKVKRISIMDPIYAELTK